MSLSSVWLQIFMFEWIKIMKKHIFEYFVACMALVQTFVASRLITLSEMTLALLWQWKVHAFSFDDVTVDQNG